MASVPNPITDANGNPYSGAVLKAYLSGTTTSTSIAIAGSGTSPQTTITANAAGIWEVSGNEVVPYIDRVCKWGIFANSTDAAANTPFYMGPFDAEQQIGGGANLTTYDLLTDFATSSHTGLITGHTITTNHYDSNRQERSGGKYRHTGVAPSIGKAGNVPDADGLFYDVDGEPFALDGEIWGEQFGVLLDATTDNKTALTAAMAWATSPVNGGQGAWVNLGTGVCGVKSTLTIPNRVGIRGANGRGTKIKALAPWSGTNMVHEVNGTTSSFGCQLVDLHLDADNLVATVMQADAWQETGGAERVLFQNGINYGIRISNGYGGASYTILHDCEVFMDNAAALAGIKVNSISDNGGFLLMIDGISIVGGSGNQLPIGVDMVNDSLYMETGHFEYTTTCVALSGLGTSKFNLLSGSDNNVVDMITVSSTFTGHVHATAIVGKGATGKLFRDNIDGTQDVPVSVGSIQEFIWRTSSFSAHVGATISNVTGNNTAYNIPIAEETFDSRGEYDGDGHRLLNPLAITGVSQAEPAVVTSTAHGLSNATAIWIKNTGGMTEINSQAFTVAGKTDNTFQLNQTGTHTGSNNASVLTDSTAAWVVNDLIGSTITNDTDGSSVVITANTATTITGTLTGGAENDWDTDDAYTIVIDSANYTPYTSAGTIHLKDTGSGQFTCKIPGLYQFNAQVALSGLTTTVTEYTVLLGISDAAKNVTLFRGVTDDIFTTGTLLTVSGSALVRLAVGETARIQINVAGMGADTVDIVADETSFQGAYICR